MRVLAAGPALAGVVALLSIVPGFGVNYLVPVGEGDCSTNATFAAENIFSITWFNQVCNCGFSNDDIEDLRAANTPPPSRRFNRRLQQTTTDYEDDKDMSLTVMQEKLKGERPRDDDPRDPNSSGDGEYSTVDPDAPNSENDYPDSRSDDDPFAKWKQYFPEEIKFIMKRHKDKDPELYDYLFPDYKDANPSPSPEQEEDSGDDDIVVAQEQAILGNAERSAIAQKAAEAKYPEITQGSVKTDALVVNTAASSTCAAPTIEQKTAKLGAQWYYTSFDADYKLHEQSIKVHLQSGLSTNEYAKIVVDEEHYKQTMSGFGATLTESSAYVLMDVKVADCTLYWKLLKDLFSCNAKGSQSACFRALRIPLSSSEFIVNSEAGYYTHDDVVCDFHLRHVNLTNDEDYIIPILKDILHINPEIKLFGIPFTAPLWMKKPIWWKRGELFFSEANYKTYAHLLAKILKLYQTQHGITFAYLSLQNEPLLFELAEAPAMRMWPDMQALFLEQVPKALEQEQVSPKPKILIFEHNWNATAYAEHVMWSSSDAAKIADGIAYHCYEGVPESMSVTHAKFSQKEVHVTQCRGFDDSFSSIQWNSEFLYVGSVMNGAQTIMHWPLALNPWGGPRKDGCIGCHGLLNIYVNRSASPAKVFYNKNQEYYGLAMTSKFLEKGAKRLYTQFKGDQGVVMRSAGGSGCIWGTAYGNPSGTTVVYIHQNCKTGQYVSIQLLKTNSHLDLDELAPGIHTFLLPHMGSLVNGGLNAGSSSSVYDGPYESCKVFADTDGDLKHDVGEPHSITDKDGRHDSLQQGLVSPLVVPVSEDCKDSFTGQKLNTLMRAPPGSKHVSPFTTGVQTIMEHLQKKSDEEHLNRNKRIEAGKLSHFDQDYKDVEHADHLENAIDWIHRAMNISDDVDIMGDLLQQLRNTSDMDTLAKLLYAYNKLVKMHAQNAIVDRLYLEGSHRKAEPELQTAFHQALAEMMPVEANFSSPEFLTRLDAHLHEALKGSMHYRFSDKSEDAIAEIKRVWKLLNQVLMSWFVVIEDFALGGKGVTAESTKEAVFNLTKLSCALNSEHLLDTILTEMHLGGSKVGDYVASVQDYMDNKCHPRPELEFYWTKTTTSNPNLSHAGLVTAVIVTSCFLVAILLVVSMAQIVKMREIVAHSELHSETTLEKMHLVKTTNGSDYHSTVDQQLVNLSYTKL